VFYDKFHQHCRISSYRANIGTIIYAIQKCCPTTCHEGAWVEKMQSSYSFSTSALDGVEWSASHTGRALAPEKGPPVPTGQRAGWTPKVRGKILSPLLGIEPWSSGRPSRSQTLYWLSYRAHNNNNNNNIICLLIDVAIPSDRNIIKRRLRKI
jgi:hypothetical protein